MKSSKSNQPSPEILGLARDIQAEVIGLTDPSQEIDTVFGHHLAIALRDRIDGMSAREREAFLEKFFSLEEAKNKLGELVVANTLAENRQNIEYELQKYRKLSFTNIQPGQTVTLFLCDPDKSERRVIPTNTIFPRWQRRLHLDTTDTPGTFEVISDEIGKKYAPGSAYWIKETVTLGKVYHHPEEGMVLEPAAYLGQEVQEPPRSNSFTFNKLEIRKKDSKAGTQGIQLVVGQIAVDGNYIFPVQ